MSFDLNIKNYNLRELEEIFELPSSYDASVVEMQETKLRQNIMTDSSISASIKTNTLGFLESSKKALIENIQKGTVHLAEAPVTNGLSTAPAFKDGDVIKASDDPLILREQSKYKKGTHRNPLDKKIVKKSVSFDTRFRDNYFLTTPSDFSVDLPMKINNVVSMQITAMELPTSFYNIDRSFGNNFFALVDPVNHITQMVTIPDGNYTYADLINQVNVALYALDVTTIFSNVVFTLDINKESGSGRVLVSLGTCTTNPTTNPTYFTLNFQTDEHGNEDRTTPLPLKFGWMLGFRNGMYTNNISYISEGLIDLSSPRYVFFCVDDHNNSMSDNFYSVYSSSVLNKNILARISVRGNVFNYMAQNNLGLTTNAREYYGPVNINKLSFQLLDEFGRVLNLHNMDYSFCLTFETVFDF